MTRLFRASVLASYAASLLGVLLTVCTCPTGARAVAEDHGCCAGTGLQAVAFDCCPAPSFQAKAPAVPENATGGEPAGVISAARSIETAPTLVAAASSVPARTASPPTVLRI